MHILLIQPAMPEGCSFYEIPLNLAYIASMLLSNHHDVSIIDFAIDNKERLFEVLKKQPGVIGITTYTYSIRETQEVARHCRENSPNSIIVLGGPHATFATNQALHEVPEAQFAFRGESEYTFSDFINRLDNGISVNNMLIEIEGIVDRNKNKNEHDEFHILNNIENINEIPFASHAFKLFSTDVAFGKNKFVPFLVSRGCYYKCYFCASPRMWGKIRVRDTNCVKKELLEYLRMGFYHINFRDDVFMLLPNIEEIMVFLRAVDISWACETRLDKLTPKIIDEMIASGLKRIRVSVETIHKKSLKLLNKGKCDTKFQKEMICYMTKLGIDVRVSFMVGIPGESKNDVLQTIDYALTLKPATSKFWAFCPLPGTAIRDNMKQYGIEQFSDEFHPKKSSISTELLNSNEINDLITFADSLFLDPTWS